jgi:hypothetical protein
MITESCPPPYSSGVLCTGSRTRRVAPQRWRRRCQATGEAAANAKKKNQQEKSAGSFHVSQQCNTFPRTCFFLPGCFTRVMEQRLLDATHSRIFFFFGFPSFFSSLVASI